MATVTDARTTGHAARMLGRGQELFEAIVRKTDHPDHGATVGVYTGTGDTNPTPTDDGIGEIPEMLAATCRSRVDWKDAVRISSLTRHLGTGQGSVPRATTGRSRGYRDRGKIDDLGRVSLRQKAAKPCCPRLASAESGRTDPIEQPSGPRRLSLTVS